MAHVRKPLALAAGINTLIFVGEGIAGFQAESLALLMDAVHNFSDEMALVCLYLVYVLPLRMSKNLQRTANVLNSAGLVSLSLFFLYRAIQRIINPVPISEILVIVVGMLAALANAAVARFLWKVREQNAAIRLAYLHNVGDVFMSLTPILSGLLVVAVGNPIFDPILAAIVAVWLIVSTLREVVSSRDALIWPDEAACKHEWSENAQGAS
jgi:cobalt-zinc-cadmium efflux system protein